MTGAPLPAGADTVVQVEHTDGGARPGARAPGARCGHVGAPGGRGRRRRAGRPGRGHGAGAPQIGVAAAIGAATVPVRRRPTVLVLSTGSELVAPGTPLQPGQIYESNGPMLAAAVEDAGGVAELLRFVPDDVAHLHRVLDERLAAGTVDLVLTSGGISAGAYEVVKEALAGRGVEFVKVAMQPGGPQGVGRVGGVGVVALPGNPVSSQVSFEVFVRPPLRAALGHPHPERPRVTAALAASLTSTPGRRQFRRGVLDAVAGTVREVGGPPSHLLASAGAGRLLLRRARGDHRTGRPVHPVEVWLLEG